jgi:uncharacterized BrkB/YihY/UPF0761 family membrane protein
VAAVERRGEPPEPAPGAVGEPGTASEPGRIGRTSRKLKEEQTRVVARLDDMRGRLEQALPRSPLIDAGFRAVERDVITGGIVLAGAVAFRIFLFLVPYVFVLVVGFGVAADATREDPQDLARRSGVGGLVAKAVGGAADLSGFERASALVIGLVALVFGARALVKVLRIVSGLIWGVTPGRLQSSAKAILAVVGLTTAALAFGVALDSVRAESALLGLFGIVLFALVPFTIALLTSVLLPRQPTRWPELVPGAVFLALGALVLHVVTVYWIAHEVESKTDTYGAIGSALAILLWSYLLGRLFTASSVINATLWQRRADRASRRAARARLTEHREFPQDEGYTPAHARPDSAASARVRREGSDGRLDRGN